MPAPAQDPSTAFSLTQSERHRPHALLDTHTPQHLFCTAHCFHPVHLGLLDSPEMRICTPTMGTSSDAGAITSAFFKQVGSPPRTLVAPGFHII